jgi:hypothetical protein
MMLEIRRMPELSKKENMILIDAKKNELHYA